MLSYALDPPPVTETPLPRSRSCLRSTNACCTKGQSPSYRVKLSQQAGCRQRARLLASWTPHPTPSPPPFQTAKAKEELLVKTVWCAGTVRCGQSSPGEQNPNRGKIQSCPKHKGIEPGAPVPLSKLHDPPRRALLSPGFVALWGPGRKACWEFFCHRPPLFAHHCSLLGVGERPTARVITVCTTGS